jgi:glycosyltransferase involved in cell wall biosynthesis
LTRSAPIILQRVITHYRRPFFEALHERYGWRVVAAERPPSGTFLNLADPAELPYADPFPMRFSPNGLNGSLNTRALIERFNPPAILAEFSMRMRSSYTLPVARRTGQLKRLAFWTHGWSMERPFHSLPDHASHYGRLPLFAAADHVLTYTQEGASWVQRFLGPDRVSALGNAIDDTEVRAAAAAATPAASGRPSFLSVGRLTADKGFDRLINLFDQLAQTWPNASLTLIGDGPERERLAALAADRLGRSILMPGALYAEADLAPHFLGADLYLLAGAAGLSVNHALAYGLPVVAFPRGPHGPFHHPEIEYLRHGHTGWLAEHNTGESFTCAIDAALRHFDDSKRRADILHYAQTEISMASMVDRFGRFVEKLGA